MGSIEPYDVITPVVSHPMPDKFSFHGTGFFVGDSGYFVTCRHVIDSIANGVSFHAHQISKRRSLELEVVKLSSSHDLALCKSIEAPELTRAWPIVNQPIAGMASDVETFGFWHEPRGADKLPFRERVLKGHITGISDDGVFELSFPILAGMSGSPIIFHIPSENGTFRAGIFGIGFGVRDSQVVHHVVLDAPGEREVTNRIVELGLCYGAAALFDLFSDTDVESEVIGDSPPLGR